MLVAFLSRAFTMETGLLKLKFRATTGKIGWSSSDTNDNPRHGFVTLVVL
jgi:hypothetical protein